MNFGPSNCESVAINVNSKFRKNIRRYGRTYAARRQNVEALIRFCANCSSRRTSSAMLKNDQTAANARLFLELAELMKWAIARLRDLSARARGVQYLPGLAESSPDEDPGLLPKASFGEFSCPLRIRAARPAPILPIDHHAPTE